MDFEEWYGEAKKTNDCGFTAKDFFEAGQQSKQAEIDALKAKIDENHRLIHIDDLRTLVHWTEMMASEYGDDDAVEIALRVKSMIEDQK